MCVRIRKMFSGSPRCVAHFIVVRHRSAPLFIKLLRANVTKNQTFLKSRSNSSTNFQPYSKPGIVQITKLTLSSAEQQLFNLQHKLYDHLSIASRKAWFGLKAGIYCVVWSARGIIQSWQKTQNLAEIRSRNWENWFKKNWSVPSRLK